MRSPVLAMLWENWRLTRLEAAQRLALGILLAAAVLAFGPIGDGPAKGDGAARGALFLLVWIYGPVWLSVMRLNGGRFMDGYRPGFPFYFLYPHPVRTLVLVGVPMAYNVASAAALYVVSALVLRATFGYPFPLLPLAAWIVAGHTAQWAAQWGTSNKVVQWFGALAPFFGLTALAVWRGQEWPERFEFSIGDYALMASVSVASIGLTVAGVARQRRGDTRVVKPRMARSAGFPEWLVSLFRLPCPTSSPVAAQVWFDLKSSGLPVLTIGVAIAIAAPLLFAIGIPIASVRPYAILGALVSVPVVLLALGGNAFGIRRRQGRTSASAFEATQACGTAQLACLKVLVRTACVLAALIAVGVSVFASSSLVSAWGEWVVDGKAMAPGLLRQRRAIEVAVGALTGYQLAALAVVASIGIAVIVTSRAAFSALRARYPRRVKIATALLLLHLFVLVLLVQAEQFGIASSSVLYAAQDLTNRVIAVVGAASVLATVYLFWTVLAERLLTLQQACGAILVSAAFGAAWVTVLTAAGLPLGTMPPVHAVPLLMWPTMLPLTASVLAPWSFSRIRHT